MNAANSRSPHGEVDKSAAEELGAGLDQLCVRSAEVCNSSRKSLDIVEQDLWLFPHRRRIIWGDIKHESVNAKRSHDGIQIGRRAGQNAG